MTLSRQSVLNIVDRAFLFVRRSSNKCRFVRKLTWGEFNKLEIITVLSLVLQEISSSSSFCWMAVICISSLSFLNVVDAIVFWISAFCSRCCFASDWLPLLFGVGERGRCRRAGASSPRTQFFRVVVTDACWNTEFSALCNNMTSSTRIVGLPQPLATFTSTSRSGVTS